MRAAEEAHGGEAMPVASGQAQAVTRWPAWFVWVFAACVLAKFVLVSHEEIAPRPFDDSDFAHAAARFYWGHHAHTRQPVYPLFVTATSMLGAPMRLAIEAVWALAAGVAVRGLRRCGIGMPLAGLSGVLLLFHPWSITLFSRLIQDTLYAPLAVMFFVAVAVCLAARRRRELRAWGALACVAGALAANTRPESVLLMGTLGAAALAAAVAWWFGLVEGRAARRSLVAAVLAPLLAIQGFTHAIKAVNHREIGVYATSELTMPGLHALWTALLAIPPEDPNLFLPVRRDVREKAYAASPSLATLREVLDGPKPFKSMQANAERASGIPGEYGSWNIWAIRAAALQVHGPGFRNTGDLDAFFRRCADELREATREGRLASRWVPIPMVAPEWRLLRGETPRALARSWNWLSRPEYSPASPGKVSWETERIFDQVSGRRVGLIRLQQKRGSAERIGWYSPGIREPLERIKEALGPVYGVVAWVGAVGTLLALVLAPIGLARGWLGAGAAGLLAILATAGLARVALVALLDMNGIPQSSRYLLPAAAVLCILVPVSVHVLVAAARSIKRGSRVEVAAQSAAASG